MAYEKSAECEITPGLYASLALRQQALNEAVGIRRITPQVELLLIGYDRATRQELTRQAREAVIGSGLEIIQKRMAQIMDEARTAAPTRRRELLAEAMDLQDRVNGLVNNG